MHSLTGDKCFCALGWCLPMIKTVDWSFIAVKDANSTPRTDWDIPALVRGANFPPYQTPAWFHRATAVLITALDLDVRGERSQTVLFTTARTAYNFTWTCGSGRKKDHILSMVQLLVSPWYHCTNTYPGVLKAMCSKVLVQYQGRVNSEVQTGYLFVLSLYLRAMTIPTVLDAVKTYKAWRSLP